MKNKVPARTSTKPRARSQGYGLLVSAISAINIQMVGRVATAANQALVLRNWMVGAYIVEFEQHGADRAKYGARLLETLARDLAVAGVRGLGAIVLGRCRQLFLAYPRIGLAIPSTVWTELPASLQIPSTPWMESASIAQTADSNLPQPLPAEEILGFSWSVLLEFIRIEDPWKRAFYEYECLYGHWSARQLQRQIESLLYERTGLSTNKNAIEVRGKSPPERDAVGGYGVTTATRLQSLRKT